MADIKYRLTDLAIKNIKGNIPLMVKLMEHFNRGQRTIENMLDDKDIRLTEPELLKLIIGLTGLYKEQVVEKVTETVEK